MNSKPTGVRVAGLLASVLCLMITASCGTSALNTTNMTTKVVCYVGTQDYERKVKSFKVQLDDARSRVAEFVRGQQGDPARNSRVAFGKHSIIVGDAYHF